MTSTRIMSVAVGFVAAGLAPRTAQAQAPGISAPISRHEVANVGTGNAAELATYVVEKG